MTATDTESEDSGVVNGEESAKPLNIDVKVDVTSTCERHVVVTIAQADVERYRQKTFDDVAPKAELPGFRAGKAPRKLVESRFKDQVDEQVKSSLVMDSLQQVTEGDHFSAISEPDFDYEAIDIPDEGDFRFEFTIEVRPDFDTPKWEGLKLERPVCELTDQHVDDHLARTLTRFMAGEAVDDGAKLGDTLVLNGIIRSGGKELADFEEEEVPLRDKLSFGDAELPNFGELMVGKEEGDKVATKITISDSAADEDLRGKEVDAEFEVHEVRRIEVNEVSPKMLTHLGFDSVEELRDFVRGEIQRQFEYHQQQSLRTQIVDQLTEGADWDMPESLVRRQTNRELQRMQLELQRSGFNRDQINSYLNASRMNARETTVRALREHFVLEKIAEELELEAAPEDYDREIELIAEQSDSSERSVRARLEKSGQMDALRNQIIERLVIEKITEAGKVSDKEDLGILKQESDTANIGLALAGDFDDIPEAKHDEGSPQMPGTPKLPDVGDKSDGDE